MVRALIIIVIVAGLIGIYFLLSKKTDPNAIKTGKALGDSLGLKPEQYETPEQYKARTGTTMSRQGAIRIVPEKQIMSKHLVARAKTLNYN